MNKLKGIITGITSEGQLSLVGVDVCGIMFSAVVADTVASAPYLYAGNAVNVLFKENEVVVAKTWKGQISMQNKLDCTIKSLDMGKVLCSLALHNGSFGIESLITAHAATQLALSTGDRVTAMIKANEISLSPHD